MYTPYLYDTDIILYILKHAQEFVAARVQVPYRSNKNLGNKKCYFYSLFVTFCNNTVNMPHK